MYHFPSMWWISGAQMCLLSGPVACLRQMTFVSAVDSRLRSRVRRISMRSYSGTVAVK
jgi:hypothetical protein